MREPPPDLVMRASEGDVGAQAKLCEDCRLPLRAYFLTRGGRSADIEDLVQETLGRMIAALKGQRIHPQTLSGWLIGTARHVLIDSVRRSRNEPAVEVLLEDIEEQRSMPDAERAELGRILWAAVGKLPDSRRLPFVLRWREGLPYREIGHRLGILEGAARQRVFRAIRFLQEELKGRF